MPSPLLLALLFSLPVVDSISLVYMGTTCQTSPVQTAQILSSSAQVAFEFQASATSTVSVETLSMCLGGGSYTGTFNVALHSTSNISPYFPTTAISTSLTNSVTVTTAYPTAMVTMTLLTPFTIPAAPTRYAIVVRQTGATSVRWGQVQTATTWTWPVLRQVAPCNDPCAFRYSGSSWVVNSMSLGFNLGGVVVVPPSSSPASSLSPMATTRASTRSPSITPSLSVFSTPTAAPSFPCAATPGYYCIPGSPVVALCPAGVYGATSGLKTPACSGPCSAPPGTFCPPGSTAPTATIICPVGAYCGGGGAGNVSCYPVTACTVTGLSAQPPCYFNVSTLAGNGVPSSIDSTGTSASFNAPFGIWRLSNGSTLVTDANGGKLRVISPTRDVTTLMSGLNYPTIATENGEGTIFIADRNNNRIQRRYSNGVVNTLVSGLGNPWSLALSLLSTDIFVGEGTTGAVKRVTITGSVSIVAGGSIGFADGQGAAAKFFNPIGLITDSFDNLYVADYGSHRIRLISPLGYVSTLAGSGAAAFADGHGSNANFNFPSSVTFYDTQHVIVTDQVNGKVRLLRLSDSLVTTLAGGASGFANGFGPLASFNQPSGALVTRSSGQILVTDYLNSRVRQLSCVPCPASYYCSSGAPVLCLAGLYCPFSSITPIPSPPGTFSPLPGASSPTPCFPGTYNPLFNQTSCLQCEPGYFCPSNSVTMTPCGINNYCPRGASSPTPCPVFMAVDAALGPANGPAFEVDTAACLAHCYSGGPGQTSTCS